MLSFNISHLFCSDCVRDMPNWDFYLCLLLALLATFFCLKHCHRTFKRARLIEDMPTSRIRSASQGYTELVGVAELQGNPQLAPLSNTLCLWWRYTIEKYQSSGKSSHWTTVEKRACSQPFYLKDTTGVCRVEPKGAEISCRHRKTWHGNNRRPVAPPNTIKKTTDGGLLSLATRHISVGGIAFGRRYRYTEHLIMEGDPLYTLGHFETDSGGQRTFTPEQLSGDILREWKQDFHDLLTRFDQNNDGELDLKEWQQVRRAALKEAKHRQTQLASQPPEHVITQPLQAGWPFSIGSTEQKHLAQRFRRRAAAYAVGFLIAGALSCWLITSRFL
jgi:hypothetical protein